MRPTQNYISTYNGTMNHLFDPKHPVNAIQALYRDTCLDNNKPIKYPIVCLYTDKIKLFYLSGCCDDLLDMEVLLWSSDGGPQ